jgi:hypothetical protein
MPFYQQDTDPKPLGVALREGLDALRAARFKLAHAKGAADAMTDQQFATEFGYADAQTARAEMQSGIGKLLNEDPNLTSGQVTSAVVQMLNQFG